MLLPSTIHAGVENPTFVLVLDPGHGGYDAGAVGKKGREKDINLAVSNLVKKYIAEQHPDVKIICTREKDVFIGLKERSEIANKANANLFISIHANAVAKKHGIKGAEVYTFGLARSAENFEAAKRENSVILLEEDYSRKYEGFDPNSAESYIIFEYMQNKYAEQSMSFASLVQTQLVETAHRRDRGVRQAAYLVLRESTMPRVLVELDYISNPQAEAYMLSAEGQKTLAKAISRAFSTYKKSFHNNSNTNMTKEDDKPEQTPQNTPTIYKVQILASKKLLPDKAPDLKGYNADFYTESGLYKYTVGESTDLDEIKHLHTSVVKDFKSAFIISFVNGKKSIIK
jgi:N-acetylmuramoyl-L-alanine amidase